MSWVFLCNNLTFWIGSQAGYAVVAVATVCFFWHILSSFSHNIMDYKQLFCVLHGEWWRLSRFGYFLASVIVNVYSEAYCWHSVQAEGKCITDRSGLKHNLDQLRAQELFLLTLKTQWKNEEDVFQPHLPCFKNDCLYASTYSASVTRTQLSKSSSLLCTYHMHCPQWKIVFFYLCCRWN